MIKFKKIRWKNLLSTGNSFTEVQLDKTSDTLIVGENGAGKSTILDALCFVLFGVAFRNINKPTLVNSINQSDLLVECEFDIGSNYYMIRRGIKPNIFEIYVNGVMLDQTAKAKDYQEYLEKHILHYTRKTFRQVVVLGNASFTPFMQLAAAERRAIIEDLLDIEIFSIMNVILKTKIQNNREKENENRYHCDLLNQEIELTNKHIAELKKGKETEIEENRTKITESQKNIAELQKSIEIANKEVEELSKEITVKSGLKQKLQKLMGFQDKIETNIENYKKQIEFWNNTGVCPTCETEIQPELATTKIQSYTEKQQESLVGLNKLSENLAEINDILTDINSKEEQIRLKNMKIQQQLAVESTVRKFLLSLEKKEAELLESKDNIEAQTNTLIEAKSRLVKLEEEKTALIDELQYLEIAAQLLKDTGIKTKIIKQYLPIINKLVNKHLAAMDFFVNFELDENFKETLKSRYRDDFSYENFSEGEKQRIDMALLLTWREVAKLKNSAATNLLILDEIFDSSLDGTGVEYLMNILHGLEKCNLFVISHKTDTLQDKFKSVIKFVKSGNYSRIEKS
jgi:DNA repair exonuclease SbcCD ATPase subunit